MARTLGAAACCLILLMNAALMAGPLIAERYCARGGLVRGVDCEYGLYVLAAAGGCLFLSTICGGLSIMVGIHKRRGQPRRDEGGPYRFAA